MDELRQLVAEELAVPVDPRVSRLGEAIAARHGGASRAVLFYGSCLREKQLDGLMLDFYLIVSDYRAAYDKRWLATANRLIPPNVFYFEQGGLAAKYAVLNEADFHRETSLGARSTSVWARFAQPSRLVWASDDAAAERARDAVAQAAPTLFQYAMPMMEPDRDHGMGDIWNRGFELTYGAELRAERSARPASIVSADPARFERFGEAALAAAATRKTPEHPARWWRRAQRKGKLLSVLRLSKASATFAGGVDYIAWKINRHAGTQIQIKPWQRRWPLLAAITLLPRLLKSGAVR